MKIHFHFHLNFAARNAIYAIFKTFFICVFLALISENLKYEYGKQFKVMPKMQLHKQLSERAQST